MKLLLSLALTIFGAATVVAQNKSIYTGTTVEECKPTKDSTDEGYVGLCNGVGGYKLIVMEDDLRQSINVVAPNKTESELSLWSTVSSGFSSIGEKIEWRMKGKVPVSFIVRYNVSGDGDKPTIMSYLVVVKVGKSSSCITDILQPSKTQNADARKLADAAPSKACKVFE